MAAIFQLRRGSGSIDSSIVDGELYLHKGSGSLQFSLGDGNPILLARLDQPNSGSLNLSGDITASNAYFRNNVVLGGTITIGDSTSDSVIFNADLSSSIIPDGTNVYDLGSTNKVYRNVYATSISGAIAATNGVVSGSSQIISILDSLNSFSSSQLTQNTALATISGSLISTASANTISVTNLNSFSSSQLTQNSNLATITGSLISTASANTISVTNLNSFSSSQLTQNTALATITGSLISTASANVISIAALNSYSSSLKTAIELTGSSITILGNLVVKGTQTTLDSTTIQLGDNIIELNGSSNTNAGLLVKDPTAPNSVSGSLLWDSTLDYWKGGVLGNESKLLLAGGDGIISSSAQLGDLNSFTSSTNIRLTNLESTTSSLNVSVSNINTTTASLNTSVSNINSFTSSTNERLTNLELKSASVDVSITNINLNTASVNTSVTNINLITASLNTSVTNLNLSSASQQISIDLLNTFSSSANTRFTEIGVVSGSLIASASATSQSLWYLYSSSTNHEERIDYIEGIGGISGGSPLGPLNIFSASINTFTASIAGTNAFTTSTNSRLNSIEAATSSYETNGRSIISGSSQIVPLLPPGVISGSSQISLNLPSGVVSGSSQVNIYDVENYATFNDAIQSDISEKLFTSSFNEYTASQSTGSLVTSISNLNTATSSYETKGRGIISGSSQITSVGTLTSLNVSPGAITGSSTGNIIPFYFANQAAFPSAATYHGALAHSHADGKIYFAHGGVWNELANANGNISGSSQILGGSTIHSGSAGDYQFNSIGVGTAASAVAGEIRAIADIIAFYSSDIRLKENIVPIENALSKIESISGNTYDWKEGYEEIHSHKGNDVGVIAQEIEEILPQIVTNRDNGYKAVQYEKIIPLLIEAIKELSSKIKRLENK